MSWKSAWYDRSRVGIIADTFDGCTVKKLCDRDSSGLLLSGGYGTNIAEKLKIYGTAFEIESTLKDVYDMTAGAVSEYIKRKNALTA